MFAPRTVKILILLFVAMTVGTLVLTWLDVEPIRAPGTHLTAVAAGEESPLAVVIQTDRPLSGKWRSIVIHSSAEGPGAVAGCHFLVEPAGAGDPLGIRASSHWLDQLQSAHVPGSVPAVPVPSIGVCLVGDFSKAGPSTEQQVQALLKLVTDLQKRFKIPKERVYFYWSLSASNRSPGPAFPEEEFNRALLPVN